MNKGFTIIELTVVITITALLITGAMAGLRYFQSITTLDGEANKIISAIRLSQNKATASEGGQNYGIYFDIANKQYVIFGGDTYATSSADNIINILPAQIIFDDINLGGGEFTVFNHITGGTAQNGTISIKLASDYTKIRTIAINTAGEAYIIGQNELSLPSRDSRHTHFIYNFNTKNAITMRLTFPDDSFNYDINFQNYLNASQDVFDWQGIVAVGGQNQTLEIKTHSLTDTSANFSIRRDGRYNTKAVQILLDSDNLINYSANGSTTKGTSLFITEPEWQ